MSKVIPHIIDQHAEEAAFLWLLRHAAVDEPHYDLKDLANLDERVEAHIDGLRIAGDYGWDICEKNLEFKEAGEVFAAAVLALEGDSAEKLNIVYRVVESELETVTGMISALGWVEPVELAGKVSGLLASADPLWRRVGIAACAIHRVDPKSHLNSAFDDADLQLQARALRAAGEIGRLDLLPKLLQKLTHENVAIRFWAAWSSLLLGDRQQAVTVLQETALEATPLQPRAVASVVRILNSQLVKILLGKLAQKDGSLRIGITGAGMCGDPVYIPWLIKQMENPEQARVAGEAFSLITGIDIAYDDLEAEEAPENFSAGPTEDSGDENVALDQDEDLAWPAVKLINEWWKKNKLSFTSGQRYLLGKPVSVEQCNHVLRAGKQRQRHAAAVELALMQPASGLFETRAVGRRQQKMLAV